MLNINVGDEVFVFGYHRGAEVCAIERVTRVTKLRMITDTGRAYSRYTGFVIGGGSNLTAKELTPERRAEYETRHYKQVRLGRIAKMRARLANYGEWVYKASDESFAAVELAIERLWHDYAPGSLEVWEKGRKETEHGQTE